MLRIFDHEHSRRDFLQVGSLAMGGLGLSLPSLLKIREASALSNPVFKDRSVVLLFMHGGPPQAETFDPKMTAPSGVRSVTGEIPTSLTGVTYGSSLTKLAKLAHLTNVVRSFTTGNGNHDIKPVVSPHTFGANMGSIYSRVAGSTRKDSGIPTNVNLFPRAVCPDTQPANRNFGKFEATGPFGSANSPFVPGSGNELQSNMRLNISRDRLADRKQLLTSLDGLKRDLEKVSAIDGMSIFREQAYSLLLGEGSKAFDLSGEDPKIVERYDTSRLVDPKKIDKKWNNHKNYKDHGQSLGKLMLLARRLCEAGCGFITVTTNFVWDMHADKNNATIDEGMRYCGLPFDHAVSTFIEDVEARGLSDKILLIACGEMGRNPKVNKRGGRDHWGRLAPLMIYGGGLTRGQIIGRSSPDVGEPASDPVTIKNLVATVLHSLFDVGELRLVPGLPREIFDLIDNTQPIRPLFS